MIIGIVVLAAIALAWIAARPASARSTARGDKRRARLVGQNPTRATSYDVDVLLSQELSADATVEVGRLALVRDVPSELLWTWAESHSATELAYALGAGFGRHELAQTAHADIEIDQESLQMHAELNRSLIGSMLDITDPPSYRAA